MTDPFVPMRGDAVSHWLAMRIKAARDDRADQVVKHLSRLLTEYCYRADCRQPLPVTADDARRLAVEASDWFQAIRSKE